MNLWAKTLWSEIDVEAVESECKRLSKEVRSLDKCSKEWDPLVVMESELLNLLTSLRVLTSIQNPCIKDRHFDELRVIVGYYFEINERTTFSDLVHLKVGSYSFDLSIYLSIPKSKSCAFLKKTKNNSYICMRSK